MRVVLISPYSQIPSDGLRILSACLKRAGFETRMIFLPDVQEMIVETDYGARRVAPRAQEQIVALCADAALVGISLMTSSFFLARQLTQAIHTSLDIPIIWGGAHPTIRPQECLRHADLVCIGEGEETIVELARRIAAGTDYHDVKNLAWLDAQGELVTNPLHPLIQNLDDLPFPDYEFEQHYVLHEGRLCVFSQDLMTYYLGDIGSWTQSPVYSVMTTRGCPYQCTYCINNALADIYPAWCKLRRRSPENVIAEIESVRARIPTIGAIIIRDDTFLANPESYIADFAQLYRERVNLPFRAYTTAQTANRAKLQHLVDAGLRLAIMGIQTGSTRTKKLYKRNVSNERMLRAARLLHSFREQIPRPMYDVITDNPYDTIEDRFETLRLIHQLPRPYKLSLYALTFYPGTELHRVAQADGLIHEEEQTIYERNFQMVTPNYYNFALFCHHLNLPAPLLYILSRRTLFSWFSWGPLDRLFGWLLSCLLALRLQSNQRLNARRRKEQTYHVVTETACARED